VEKVDATKWSNKERKAFYDSVILRWHDEQPRKGYYFAYPLRTTPGSAKDYDFGVKRPILIVYRDSRKQWPDVVDVYPHKEKRLIPQLESRANRSVRTTVTVSNFLRNFRNFVVLPDKSRRWARGF